MIKKAGLLAVAAVMAVPLTMVIMPSATAAARPGVRITTIFFNPPGPDDRSNKSLNHEWVRIKNFTGSRKRLTHWTLRDASGHVYRFPRFHLAPGAAVWVHTGRGTNRPHNLYWGRRNHVWTNTGDRAALRKGNGVRVDRCRYTKAESPVASC
jgi:hypothetical protein